MRETFRNLNSWKLSHLQTFRCTSLIIRSSETVKNLGVLPQSTTLRSQVLPKVFDVAQQELRERVAAASSIVIAADEASDQQDRFILHIVFILPVTSGQQDKMEAVTADLVFLDKVNATTVSRAIIQTLTKFDVDFDKVVVVLTDNATYMTKAVTSLKVLLPNCIHLTCNAHILSLVELNDLFKTDSVRVDVVFIMMNSAKLMDLLTWFENRQVTIHLAYNKVVDLMAEFGSKGEKEKNKIYKKAFQDAAAKLNQYYTETSARFTQPGLSFMKAVRGFDPAQAKILSLDGLSDGIPECAEKLPEIEGELAAYKQCALEIEDGVKPAAFWFSQKDRLPNLSRIAIRYLSVPGNSVDAERSVSAFNTVDTVNRQSFEENNLASHAILVTNSKI
ncbi:p20-CGGBP [Culex quinquefasciatus]|uniref:p20-CGGBP n=1 Tax=Culex quinquefasciatus TaxID=7176 RepID=B0VZD3_CULQU|nr:p20-CGGBP [Culex quinquefasciatus]|eukprot:XP_001841761.1 p20-CGGBP [Culex quinquefasciatus]